MSILNNKAKFVLPINHMSGNATVTIPSANILTKNEPSEVRNEENILIERNVFMLLGQGFADNLSRISVSDRAMRLKNELNRSHSHQEIDEIIQREHAMLDFIARFIEESTDTKPSSSSSLAANHE